MRVGVRGSTLCKYIPEYRHRSPVLCSVAITVKHGTSHYLSQNSTRDITYISYISQWSVAITNYHISENCSLLGYYAARSDNFLPTFRDNLSVASSSVKTKFLES